MLIAQKVRGVTLSVLRDLCLLSLSALLFALSFPSFLSTWGWFPIAFVSLIPLFIVIHKTSWLRIWLWGIFFGFASYALFNFWLRKFHPLAHLIVPTIYAVYFLIVFPVLKLVDELFPKYGYLLQPCVWICYEYLRTQGFLAYSYGILGYSQYLFRPFIQIASIAGVWGVSLLVVFPSVLLGNALKEDRRYFVSFMKRSLVPIGVYALLVVGNILFGLSTKADYADVLRWKVALIQQNVDPWKGGDRPYERSLNILTRLSREAILENPDIVVWSETSFVPAIDWHTRFRTSTERYLLVKRLRDFLYSQSIPYVIGNDDGQLERTESGSEKRVDYNANILFVDGEIVQTYRKLHLVPFTEYFPYEKTFPRIYEWLKNADTHFWKKGTEYTVFEVDSVRFSTPICFEDTFGYLCRDFVRRGAQVLVNMTNDWWSQSVAAEMQHMNAAIFRAVENRRTVVRSTNGGITCTIDPNGKILDIMDPFVEGYLVSSVPIYSEYTTLYTRWGDWLPQGVLVITVIGIGIGVVKRIILLRRQGAVSQ